MWDVVGGDNFSEIGHQFLRYFIDFGLVKPEDDVLDMNRLVLSFWFPCLLFWLPDESEAFSRK
jgi:hypothetical protein